MVQFKHKQFNILVPNELAAAYAYRAEAEGISKAALGRMALELFLANADSAYIEVPPSLFQVIRRKFGADYQMSVAKVLRFYCYEL